MFALGAFSSRLDAQRVIFRSQRLWYMGYAPMGGAVCDLRQEKFLRKNIPLENRQDLPPTNTGMMVSASVQCTASAMVQRSEG